MENLFAGNIELPMLEEKTQILNHVGTVLAGQYNGRFHNFVASGSPRLYDSGNGLVERLVSEFPRFGDVSPYDGHTIKFYKLPQLAMWFLYTNLGKTCKFRIDDLETMSAFADYIVPVALRLLGITSYSAELERAINSYQLIPHDSAREVEIRAHCIYASALLAEEINLLRPSDWPDRRPADRRAPLDPLPHHLVAASSYKDNYVLIAIVWGSPAENLNCPCRSGVTMAHSCSSVKSDWYANNKSVSSHARATAPFSAKGDEERVLALFQVSCGRGHSYFEGKIYVGCNVENSSYGMTNCAERTAIFSAIAKDGPELEIRAVAVANDHGVPCSPCGAAVRSSMNLGRAPSSSTRPKKVPKHNLINRSSAGGLPPQVTEPSVSRFRAIDLIRKKRDGGALSAA